MIALEKIQDAFDGEAERLGLETEEDVLKMIKEYRPIFYLYISLKSNPIEF